MRKTLFRLASVLISAGVAHAQSQSVPAIRISETPALIPVYAEPAAETQSRFWGNAEYLLWFVKESPFAGPLVSTGDPTVGINAGLPISGALGQNSTQILYGNNPVSYKAASGGRLILGGWLNADQSLGFEVSAFFLQSLSSTFSAGSDAAGNPPLYFPVFNVAAGQERSLAISDPLNQFAGNVNIVTTSQFWGGDANGIFNITRKDGVEFSLLGGFRYANLAESLAIRNTTNDLLLDNTTVLNDQFDTKNQFYGAQIGTRLNWERDRFSVGLTGKVALGVTRETVNIYGNSSQSGPGAFAPGSFNGGLYTQASNIGQQTKNFASSISSVEAKLGYRITPQIRATLGYDYLFWSNVARATNQFDRNINPNQSAILGNGVIVAADPAQPAPQMNQSNFSVHGVSFGLEFRY